MKKKLISLVLATMVSLNIFVTISNADYYSDYCCCGRGLCGSAVPASWAPISTYVTGYRIRLFVWLRRLHGASQTGVARSAVRSRAITGDLVSTWFPGPHDQKSGLRPRPSHFAGRCGSRPVAGNEAESERTTVINWTAASSCRNWLDGYCACRSGARREQSDPCRP